MNKSEGHLSGLDGLRAIAATVVLIGHTYQIAGIEGYDIGKKVFEYFKSPIFSMVNLFFVISGFIITLLLTREKANTNTINLANFYKKRILRIWPLYFSLLLIAYLLSITTPVYGVFNNSLTPRSFLFISLFLVNFEHVIPLNLLCLPHYWSLSVEEQFYIFWPVSIRKFKALKVCIFVIIFFFLLKKGFYALHLIYKNEIFLGVYQMLNVSTFGSMAIGGIASIIYSKNKFYKVFSGNNLLWFGTLLITGVLLAFSLSVPLINSELQAVLFAVLILCGVYRGKTFLDHPILKRLGKISYGIYMFHWPVIPIFIYVFKYANLGWIITSFFCIPFLIFIFIVTTSLAYLSYSRMELPIMKLYRPRN